MPLSDWFSPRPHKAGPPWDVITALGLLLLVGAVFMTRQRQSPSLPPTTLQVVKVWSEQTGDLLTPTTTLYFAASNDRVVQVSRAVFSQTKEGDTLCVKDTNYSTIAGDPVYDVIKLQPGDRCEETSPPAPAL